MPKRVFLLPLVLIGALVSGCGGDGEPDATVRSTTVEQILRDPESWDEGPAVTVRGRAYPRERGFVLIDSGSSIWVAAPSGVEAIERGDRVAIRGEVERLTRDDADEVVKALRDPVGPALAPPQSEAVEQTPAEIGQPFIVFRALVWGGNQRPPADEDTEPGEPGAADADEEVYDGADVQDHLEAAGLMLVRTGGGSGLEEEIDEPTLAAHRYEIVPSSREFELLVFPSRAALERALEDLRQPDLLIDQNYRLASGANVVAAFPPPRDDFRGYEVVRRVLAELD